MVRSALLGIDPAQHFISKAHRQIYGHSKSENGGTGAFQPFRMEDAPEAVVQTVVKATNLIGNGLYGVDLKQTEKEVVVIEVNDNPSIEAGVEEAVLQGELYKTIIEDFVWRLDRKRVR